MKSVSMKTISLSTRVPYPCFAAALLVLGTAVLPLQAVAQDAANSVLAIEEIVVTARKREESLQDTPISISAFSADRLEAQGITKINRLQDLTPNLVFQNTPSNSGVGSSAAVYIRGIGQKDFAPTTEPGVGIYIDGAYVGRSVGAVFDMIDIEQVEILRGPQGTLFGRNTIGGAISITTKKPSEEFHGKADVKFGTDGRTNVRGTVNVPFSDTFFMRASASSFQQDGYVNRPFDGADLGDQDYQSLRAAFRWFASDAFEANLAIEYATDATDGAPVVITGVDDPSVGTYLGSFVAANNAVALGDPFSCFDAANATNPACYNDQVVAGRNTNLGSGPMNSDIDTTSATLTLNWDFDGISFKSITAFRQIDGLFFQDRDGFVQLDDIPGAPFNPLNHVADTFEQDQFTQEFQLQGKAADERLNWLLGAYYFQEDGENLNEIDFRVVSAQSGGFFDYTSIALFGQLTYDLTDRASVTVGLRYTEDDRDYTPDQFFQELPLGPLGFPCFVPDFHIPCVIGDRIVPFETVNNSIEETTPYLNLSYALTDSTLAYFSYSEGYKSDGFTQRVFPPEPSLPSFEPEFVDSYEIGLKYENGSGTVRANSAIFYTDYTDLQLLVADASRIGPFFTNAGDATISGLEFELAYVPADNWRIDFGAGYTDAEFDTLLPGAVAAGLTLDSPFVLVSEWNLNASIEKLIPLSGGATLTPRIDWNWRSEFFTNANGIPFRPDAPPLFQPDYSVTNVNIAWRSASDKYHVTVGVDNVGDEEYRIFGDYQPGFGFDLEAFHRGREWYLNAGVSF